MKDLRVIVRFLVMLLLIFFIGVWLAAYYFDSEREGYILRGMKAGIIVSMLMVGIAYLFKEVIITRMGTKKTT